jgi:hypothetical protein
MKTLLKDKIQTIRNNESNRVFFKASDFHGDKGYTLVKKDGAELFCVKTNHGFAYYKLDGSRIGSYTTLFKN